MGNFRERISLVEYGSSKNLTKEISKKLGVDKSNVDLLLNNAGKRIASLLNLSENPIINGENGYRAIKFAGLVRLSPSLELEVAPKFLGLDETDSTWREDFFYLSFLSSHGQLLAFEKLSSSGGVSRGLPTLVAHALVCMYDEVKRRPLRTYRKVYSEDFFLDGEPEPIDLIFPSSEGFKQEVIRFDRVNEWNSNILAATNILLPQVQDPGVMGRLLRLRSDLSPQRNFSHVSRKKVPPRHRSWNSIHALSVDILNGLGLHYNQGLASAPGYVISTWRVWEDLVTIAVRLGFGAHFVSSQKQFLLGRRERLDSYSKTKISVYPDCIIESNGKRPRVIVDAKYKGHIEKRRLRIDESDIYEALAFSRASKCGKVVLIYPAAPCEDQIITGRCTVFERINIDDIEVIGVQVEVRCISKEGGLNQFALNLCEGISSIIG
ncbi:McrC family protein [Shewanella sp. Isolate8]|uniref:McrC family protein n=1 Tax=Shewanella sp. Isolate8 TaxID=2908529 RepID=UPI001EFC8E43|nr:McrC family protein [Shewanella sp. Isolate8]MCG9745045.1 McrC family protein [Shewanella sp. Isolate8]